MVYKLLMLRPTLGQGGADRVTLTLLQSLDRTLFDLSLALMRREGEWIDEVPGDVSVFSLNASTSWTAWLPLIGLLRRERPDILFSTSSGSNVVAVLAHLLAGGRGRLILSERNVLLHGRIGLKRRFVFLLKRLLYRQADHITAVSQGVKDDLVRQLKLAPDSISVVYNPIVSERMVTEAAEVVEHPWFDGRTLVILGAGRLVMEKDFETLIRAFALVRSEVEAKLVILGEGPLRNELELLAEELGVGEDVWFGGFVKNPFKYMARCTVFVLSSRFEGLPGVLVQAMACGAAVISTNCPAGPSEIIRQGEDGFLVPMGDVAVLAERIKYLLANVEVREVMAGRARESALQFRVEPVLDNYTVALLNGSRRVIDEAAVAKLVESN